MQLNTRHFGEIEIDESNIIDFPEGIPGFEDVKKFVLLGESEEESLFRWLQGVDNPDLAFVVINPYSFKPDYDVEVDDSQVEVLDIKDTQKVLVYNVVVIPEDIKKISANMKYPVLINTENKKGKQVPLEKDEYEIRHYILEELHRFSQVYSALVESAAGDVHNVEGIGGQE